MHSRVGAMPICPTAWRRPSAHQNQGEKKDVVEKEEEKKSHLVQAVANHYYDLTEVHPWMVVVVEEDEIGEDEAAPK